MKASGPEPSFARAELKPCYRPAARSLGWVAEEHPRKLMQESRDSRASPLARVFDFLHRQSFSKDVATTQLHRRSYGPHGGDPGTTAR